MATTTSVTAMHVITLTKNFRQVGRSRITDHDWVCSRTATSTALHGFSTERDARADGAYHASTANRAAKAVTR